MRSPHRERRSADHIDRERERRVHHSPVLPHSHPINPHPSKHSVQNHTTILSSFRVVRAVQHLFKPRVLRSHSRHLSRLRILGWVGFLIMVGLFYCFVEYHPMPHSRQFSPQLDLASESNELFHGLNVTSMDYFASILQFAAPTAPKDSDDEDDLLPGLTRVPIVHECERRNDPGGGKLHSSKLDFSAWHPEGDWPPPKRLPKLKVALFAGVYNHVVDGVALTCNRLVAYLLHQGHEVLVIAPTSETPKFRHAGQLVSVASISAPGRPEYRIALGLTSSARQALEDFQPSLVHIATPDVLGFQAQAWAWDRSLPVVCAYHTHFAQYLAYYHLSALETAIWGVMHRFYSRCLHTYVPTASVQAELEVHGVVEADQVRVWTRGVDTALFNPSRRCPEWRDALDSPSHVPIVLLVCRLVWEKALAVYAEVLLSLVAKGVPLRAVIVGDGPARTGLQEMLLSVDAVFLGSLAGEELARAYASSDIFLFPSLTETFGVTTLEAMSSGLPVVVADKNETTIVEHDSNGFTARTQAQFAEYTEMLCLDENLRKTMGDAGRKRAEEKFQWGKSFTDLMNHYSDALEIENDAE